ncbi:MAG: serine/threonine-protein kinase [Acidobacteriota bacterium]
MKALAQNTLIQNRYLVVHLIGKGGMGEVYLAVDQRLGSAVALKRTFFAGDEMLGNAFEREARTLARMRHPVLPKVSDHFGENEEQYLVMEHISGDDLSKRLEVAQKPFPVSWVMFWADQLLDALSYLHSHEPPIIHRDIKPQNLKLTDENHIILLDFGLSKISTGQTHISNSGSTGSVVGYTPHYAPMEQIRGIGTNARSDIYSLSATLYQLMTNVVPADALSRADTMLNGLADPIEPPHALNPEIPTAVSDVILKGLEVSQEKRYSHAREMQKALRKAFTQMQDAMAAQTVAFNIGDVLPVEHPLAAAVEKTQLMPSVPLEAPIAEERSISQAGNGGDVDFDATLAFDPAENLEHAKQAGIKTELFQPTADSNGRIDEPLPPSVPLPPPPEEIHNSFVTVAAGARSAFAEFQAPAEPPVEQKKPVAPAKSSGKAFAVIGGLLAVLVLLLGAAGAGWYYYANFYAATVVVEPTPSPEPTVEATPIPAPTQEAVFVDTNTNTDSNSSSSSNTKSELNTNSIVPETPTRTDIDTPTSRGSQTVPKPVSSRPTTTAPKTTPKPKANPGRTDIQQ